MADMKLSAANVYPCPFLPGWLTTKSPRAMLPPGVNPETQFLPRIEEEVRGQSALGLSVLQSLHVMRGDEDTLESPCQGLAQGALPRSAGRNATWLERGVALTLLLAALVLSGCSIQRLAVNRLGDALAQGSSVYATDDDPDLVGAALPFGLKTIESLLVQSPHHKGLLLAATSGFTQYAYAFVQTEADILEDTEFARATALRERAGRLYRRALSYGLRGLEEVQPGLLQTLRSDPGTALVRFRKADVAQLYWTAAAWGAAISLNKTDTELGADLPLVEALMHRALELDEGFNLGAIHDFYIVYEGGRPAAGGGSVERARASLARALALAGGHRAAPLVSFAETVDVGLQDRAEFQMLLNQALAIDVNAEPDQRLANVIAQRRARWLVTRMDRLFLE